MRLVLPLLAVVLISTVSRADTKRLGLGELYWLLDRACARGDEMSVEMLLKAGADPSGVRGYGAFKKTRYFAGVEPMWHLIQAAYGGHTECVQLLLRAGADPNLPYGEGVTALTVAVERGHIDIVRLLLAAGADRSYKTLEGTAAEIAEKKGYKEILALLRQQK